MHGMGDRRDNMVAARRSVSLQTTDGAAGHKTGKQVQRAKGRKVATVRNVLVVTAAAVLLAACSSTPEPKSKFSPKKYGVKGSPKVVAAGQPVPKGGGRYVVGKKYKIAGKWYYPKEDPNYKKVGLASWYGPTFHGRKTANGEIFDRNGLTAAHTTMPLPSYAKVTNMANGRSMVVRVNDRGPFHGNRVIDLSERVATLLGTKEDGVGNVKVEYVGRARLDGQDEEFLMASLTGPGAVSPGATMPGTLLAQAQQPASPVFVAPVSGPARAPAPRPYLVASAPAPASASYQVAYDPALAFEASSSTIRVASANTFAPTAMDPAPTAYAEPVGQPASGVLGVLRVPAPSVPRPITSGSAISSYSAHQRIDMAYSVLETQASSGMSMRMLAAAKSSE